MRKANKEPVETGNELLEAIKLLEKEKNISRESLLDAITNSLLSACKNNYGTSDNVDVIMDRETCKYRVVQKKLVVDKMPENPTEYDIANARFGFPVTAFKACAIDAGYQQGIIPKKTTARGAFHILGDFAEIEGKPQIREDMVRVGMGVADIRYRGEFPEWSVVLTIRYNPRAMSAEQIINLLNFGGFSNGVGEWRPEKDGDHGTFHVAVNGE